MTSGDIEKDRRGAASLARDQLVESVRSQARACQALGSPLYAGLLHHAAADIESGGPTGEVLCDQLSAPGPSAVALRLMGAVNRLVLAGDEPDLAALYRNDERDENATWREFRAVLGRNMEVLRGLVELPVQTNEIGRCAALLAGFLSVAEETGLPLRILEVGSSAGLNLSWDRYRYEGERALWGPAESPVTIPIELEGPGRLPDLSAVEIAERGGCDASPIDPTTPEGRLGLLAYVWPDQRARVERLHAALDFATQLRTPVERAGAASWVERLLGETTPDRATVVFHLLVMQYLSEEERAAFCRQIKLAGALATADAPLAWLRMEPGGERADVRLSVWPPGDTRRIARAGYHGTPLALSS